MRYTTFELGLLFSGCMCRSQCANSVSLDVYFRVSYSCGCHFMEVITEVAIVAEEADDEQVARSQSGEHVTLLNFPTDKISCTLADGATVEAVAVDGARMVEVGSHDSDTGDTTELSADSAVEAGTDDPLQDVDKDDEETGKVDFGWELLLRICLLTTISRSHHFPHCLQRISGG